jgi:putative ABC transport system ATP-binding protein
MYMVAGQAAIVLRDVVRRFAVAGEAAITALDGVSLDIAAGSAVGLAGPSGSGKSTLLHIVGALERPDAGTVCVGGRPLAACRAASWPSTAAASGSCSSASTCCPR